MKKSDYFFRIDTHDDQGFKASLSHDPITKTIVAQIFGIRAGMVDRIGFGVARCNFEDKYNMVYGERLALRRAMRDAHLSKTDREVVMQRYNQRRRLALTQDKFIARLERAAALFQKYIGSSTEEK